MSRTINFSIDGGEILIIRGKVKGKYLTRLANGFLKLIFAAITIKNLLMFSVKKWRNEHMVFQVF